MRLAAVLLLCSTASRTVAQEPLQNSLTVQQGGKEIGREDFTLRSGRGRGTPGTTLIASARYPAENPTLKLNATLERTEEFALAKFQLDVDGPNGPTVILAAGSGVRLIVRTVAKGSEAGRELPGGPDVVLLDEAVYSLYAAVADVATPSGKALTAIFPRTGRRANFTARRDGDRENGAIRVTLTGDITGSLVTDAQGRLQRLELPQSGTVVSRAKE
jgi:hypothetical protein